MSALESVRVRWARIGEGTPRRAVAWGLLRSLAPGAEPSNPCPRCGGPHGPVHLSGVDAVASVAYTESLAVVAIGDGRFLSSLGVDAEAEAASPAGLDLIIPAPADRRAWVRTEATLKADRRGLRVDPGLVEIRETSTGWNARLRDRGEPFLGRDVPGPPGILVSIAGLPRR